MLAFKKVRNVIVTTRATIKLRGARYINLTGLSLEDTAVLLSRAIRKDISTEDVTRLAEEVRGSPAALDLVAGFLEEHDVDEVWGFLEGKLYDLRDEIKATPKQLVRIVNRRSYL
jgi:hypothetical protein